MRELAGLILLVTLMLLLIGASTSNATDMNPQSQVHSAHIGTGTANLNCDTCHGIPPNTQIPQVRNGSGPGQYIVCERCHAPPPDSFNPSNGNLIVIHLSRGLYCTNCHDTDKINPTHPSTKAENGTVQIIKCENCHANSQNSASHINGGKYCLDCHGNKTATLAITPIQTVPITNTAPITSVSTPASTIASVSTMPVQTPKKRAQLQVTYEIGAGRTKQEPTVSVHLKNIGSATATKVNLEIDNPSDLQATVLSGSEQTGNTITWKGEIEPGKEHIAQYEVKIVTGKDIEVPLKVTYVKITQEEKARELGFSSASAAEVNAALTPEEIELITLVMKITLSAIPGFEGIMMAIALMMSAGIILRKRGR